MKKILVIDDHPAVMEGTKSILESDQQLSVDCLSPDAEAAFLKTHDFSIYDVILMDLNLGDINGMDIAKQILETNQLVKIIIYTGYEVDDYFEEAIRAGLHGAISKTETKDKIIEYIHRTLQGEVVIQLSYLKKLISQQQEKPEQAQQTDHELLTERECLILREVEKGYTNQEIADVLHLSKRSIEYSLTSIFNKLNVGSRTEAVLIAKSESVL
ncbi:MULTISPECIES: response regulator transcription factor [Bacillus]|jgi:two-component system competent response regulator ComA|uniref:response regulator transcription factor n=1 Tax=Bacillus TaxID=1386 RepID=UPI000760DDC0|nr:MULTISPECIES: response regulator transcription factor [Bacillus]AOC55597.1 DNA-binding response regulator [Bacillus pumilus]AZV53548.1 DNA-binding response regulator [Bacillus pumilus]MBR0587315.1 response regulator transcription factor [Bacillus pumilus DW2J2]MBR0617566.1 response regulator transcription factor [Bacillus pumilus]MBR0620942.1 response regulator transcription factor [Bacillus pumilus]